MADNFVKTVLEVERAASDFRRNVPVMIRKGDAVVLCISAERLAHQDFDVLRKLAGTEPVLLLTQKRAAVLKVQHKGAKTVRLKVPEWLAPVQVSALADPSSPYGTPLSGPHQALTSAAPDLDDAVVRLARLAQMLPTALIADMTNDDVASLVQKQGLLAIAAETVLSHEQNQAHDLRLVARAKVPLAETEKAEIWAFRSPSGGPEHLAIVVGEIDRKAPVLIRLHSECFTGDLLGSLKCDCGDQLRGAIDQIAKTGSGVLLYLAQEGRGIGLIAKLKAYALQSQGFDTVDANLRLGFDVDERIFEPAANMLKHLGIDEVRLMTNNPDKVNQLAAAGIKIVERVAHKFPSNQHNDLYLKTKRDRTGHFL